MDCGWQRSDLEFSEAQRAFRELNETFAFLTPSKPRIPHSSHGRVQAARFQLLQVRIRNQGQVGTPTTRAQDRVVNSLPVPRTRSETVASETVFIFFAREVPSRVHFASWSHPAAQATSMKAQ
jgi:hypothetical protein